MLRLSKDLNLSPFANSKKQLSYQITNSIYKIHLSLYMDTETKMQNETFKRENVKVIANKLEKGKTCKS